MALGLFLLGACNVETAERSTETTRVDADEPVTAVVVKYDDATINRQLDGTASAVRGMNNDITSLPGDAATKNIDTWIEQLEDRDVADKVTANLKKLRTELSQPNINGQLVGLLLTTLAADTKDVTGTNGNAGYIVQTLREGGNKLTSATIKGSDLLPQTLQAVAGNEADLTKLPGSAAVSNIDSWLNKLRGMNGTDAIVRDLEMLKMELGAASIDGSKVSGILFGLAEKVRGVGSGNDGLEALAYALEAGGWRLKGK